MKSNNVGTDSSIEPAEQNIHWSQATQRHYDPSRDDGLTTAIVLAIAEAKDVPVTELRSPPLYEVVDVSAIDNAFFDSSEEHASRQVTGTIEFRCAEYRVKVRSDGWIQVYESPEIETPGDTR